MHKAPRPGVAVAKQRRRHAPAHCQPCSRCRRRRRCCKLEQRGLGARDVEELDGRHPRCRWRRSSPRTRRRWQRRVRKCRSRSPTARRTYGCAQTQTESNVRGQRERTRQPERGQSTCFSKSHLPSRTRGRRSTKKMWNSPAHLPADAVANVHDLAKLCLSVHLCHTHAHSGWSVARTRAQGNSR